MKYLKKMVLVVILAVVSSNAWAATVVIRLAPENYNIFLFSDGGGFFVLDAPVFSYTGALNCRTDGASIIIPSAPTLSNRAFANLLAAKTAGADIFLQVTDDVAPGPANDCWFNGSTYIGIPQ